MLTKFFLHALVTEWAAPLEYRKKMFLAHIAGTLAGSGFEFAGLWLLSSEFVNIQGRYIQCIGTFQNEAVSSLKA